jgi:hypothetical protein
MKTLIVAPPDHLCGGSRICPLGRHRQKWVPPQPKNRRLPLPLNAMKNLLAIAAAILAIFATSAEAGKVRGYVKKDGTYVAPHQRTNPNSKRTDNYGTKGNTNPYTGQQGTKDADK